MQSLKPQSLEEPICDTCLTRLEDTPFRKLVLKDKKGEPLIVCIHYFSPCWDFDLLNEKYHSHDIVYAAFSMKSKNLTKNPKVLRNLRNNYDLW